MAHDARLPRRKPMPAQRQRARRNSPHVPPENLACHLLCYRSDLRRGELPFFLYLALHFPPYPFQHSHCFFASLIQNSFTLLARVLQNRLFSSVAVGLRSRDFLFVLCAQSRSFAFQVG